MMSNKVLLSLATVALFAATAKADATGYTVESTNSWFSITAASEDFSAGWSSTPSIEDSLIKIDTTADAPVKYTPANDSPVQDKPTATRYRVTGSMEVTLNASVPAADVFGETVPKAALVAVAGDPNKWYAWQTNAVSGTWVEMSGHTPIEGTTYTNTIEFTSTTVSYKVNGTQLETAGESPSSTLDTVEGTSIASVGLAGFGSFGDFSAVGYEEFEVTVSDADLAKYGIDSEKDMAAELNAPGANGYPKWQSIVLGLKDSASQPYLVPVQNATTDTLSIKLGGVNLAEGYTVSYAVEEVATPNTAMSSSPNYNSPTSVNLDAGAVKYYKIKIKITK